LKLSEFVGVARVEREAVQVKHGRKHRHRVNEPSAHPFHIHIVNLFENSNADFQASNEGP
jgi:hypothetical protein